MFSFSCENYRIAGNSYLQHSKDMPHFSAHQGLYVQLCINFPETKPIPQSLNPPIVRFVLELTLLLWK